MDIYQVVIKNKQTKKIYHVGFFKLHAYAIACMNKVSDAHNDCIVEVWQNPLFETVWDGSVNYNEELTYGLGDFSIDK